MKALAKSYAMGGMTSVYVLPDRVEIGKMGPIYNEDMRRIAFRDVRRLYVWQTAWVSRLVAAGVMALVLVVAVVALVSADAPLEAVLGTGLAGMLPTAFLAWSGRPGSMMRFRLVGMNVAIDGMVGGGAKKQAKVRDAILEGVAASRRG